MSADEDMGERTGANETSGNDSETGGGGRAGGRGDGGDGVSSDWLHPAD